MDSGEVLVEDVDVLREKDSTLLTRLLLPTRDHEVSMVGENLAKKLQVLASINRER